MPGDNTAHRLTGGAGHRLEEADVGPERRGVDQLRLGLMRAVRGQPPVERATVASEQRQRSVEGHPDVRVGAPVLVGFREPRVVAVQTAPHVVRRERPVAIQQLPPDQLHGIVVANGLGVGNTGNRLARAVTRGCRITYVATPSDRPPDILDGPVEPLVNEAHRTATCGHWCSIPASAPAPHGPRSGRCSRNEGRTAAEPRLATGTRRRTIGAADQARPVVSRD